MYNGSSVYIYTYIKMYECTFVYRIISAWQRLSSDQIRFGSAISVVISFGRRALCNPFEPPRRVELCADDAFRPITLSAGVYAQQTSVPLVPRHVPLPPPPPPPLFPPLFVNVIVRDCGVERDGGGIRKSHLRRAAARAHIRI